MRTDDKLAELKHRQHNIQLTEKEENEYAERIGAIFARQKKFLRSKEKLVNLPDPILFLQRSGGDWDLYNNVKDKEFKVPNLPDGVEKKIYLGRQYQEEIPYAGKIIRVYWCHEDWAYPFKWSKPNVYTGTNWQAIKDKVTEEQYKKMGGIPMILEHANVNAENMRDRERKTMLAWEKLLAKTEAMNWAAWAKVALYAGGAIALIIFAVNYFKKGQPQAASVAVQGAKQAATNASTIIIG